MKFLLILFSLSILKCDIREISKLKSNPVPKTEDVKNFQSWAAYVVSIKDGKPVYDFSGEKWNERAKLNFEIDTGKEKEAYFTHPTKALKIPNGWLVGFDRGEWGGALYWFSENGKSKYLIADGNIHNIISLNKKIYITQGLAHLGSDSGSISEVELNNGKWIKTKTQILNGCPFQSTIYEDKILILTTNSVILCNSALKTLENFENKFIDNLYPNSVIVYEKIAYFGMRGGILKIDLENKNQYWLTE